MSAATKAAHDEYERLYATVVFPSDTVKRFAADWHRTKELSWQFVQLEQLRVRRLGAGASAWELWMAINIADEYVQAEPPVFVTVSYYPKVVKTELASLAKLASTREEYESARLRFAKALLSDEEKRTSQR